MKIFYLIVIVVIILNQIWILCLLRINKLLDEKLQEERKKAIKEINKLRKEINILRNGDNKNDE